ncbi:MAG: hypothetical protein R3275_09840 [Saprospiraceae bacterium]|nr:hypothetical protein [Saprospiraceae bacterium]
MKRTLFFLGIFMTLTLSAAGQEDPPVPPTPPNPPAPPTPPAPPAPPDLEGRLERFEAMKVAHITSFLELTPQEAQSFWPVYNKWDEKRSTLRKAMRPEKKIEDMTEKEASDFLDKTLETRKALSEIENSMIEELKSVLSTEKVLKLVQAEHSFHRSVVQRYRKRSEGRHHHKEKQ